MKHSHSAGRLPLKIAEYINEYFPGKNLVNYKMEEDDTGTKYYILSLHDDENCYRLKFSEKGNYICQTSEALYSDYHEQYF